MTDVIQMNIFFFIASIGFVLFTIVGIIIGVLIIKLLRKLNAIADNAKEVSSDMSELSDELRLDVKEARSFVKGLFSFLKPKKKKKK